VGFLRPKWRHRPLLKKPIRPHIEGQILVDPKRCQFPFVPSIQSVPEKPFGLLLIGSGGRFFLDLTVTIPIPYPPERRAGTLVYRPT